MTNKLIIFDLDGTLTESKQPLTSEMAIILARLLEETKVAIVSGGALEQFLKQVVAQLPSDAHFANLYLLPTSGAALYEWGDSGWNKIYEERLSEKEVATIEEALQTAATETGIIDFSKEAYGKRIEWRGGQVSMSAFGQQAPIELKKAWDPDHAKRRMIQEAAAIALPEYSVAIGGLTTIDVTRRDIDKAYGVRKLCERLSIPEPEALYIGDELEAGGNDEAVYKTDVPTKSVKNPGETKILIQALLTVA